MYITNYFAANSIRNTPLKPITSTAYVSNGVYNFVSSLLFTSGQNSGLLSIGHLLSAVSETPAICSVQQVATQDRTGGIFTWASVKMLSVGNCIINWSFAGTDTRGAATTKMSLNVIK